MLRNNKYSYPLNLPRIKKQLNNPLVWEMKVKEDVTLVCRDGQAGEAHEVIVASSKVYIKQCIFHIT